MTSESSGRTASNKPYLTPNEAAALLMVAPATLRVWTDKGLLKAQTTAGGHRRFLRSEVESFRQNCDKPREPAEVESRQAQRILIVDDEAPFARYLSSLLKGMRNTETAAASDGFTAGHLVHTFRPDIVLLDLLMDGLDGFQVCRQIKSDSATRHIRIIAMSGYATPENIAQIIAAGAETCLDKPIDENRLLALLALELPA